MKLINKIKKAEWTKKTELWLRADMRRAEMEALVDEMILSMPKGHYKIHSRDYGVNLIDAVGELYGWMPSMLINESTLLGLQVRYPKMVYASFTLGLDAIEIK